MRITLKFALTEPLILPFHHNEDIQKYIYSILGDNDLSAYVHDKGEKVGNRVYKPLVFSDIKGAYIYKGSTLHFTSEMILTIDSPNEDVAKNIMLGAYEKNRHIIANQNLPFPAVSLEPRKLGNVFTTISPITIRISEGSKFKCLNPLQTEWHDKIINNLVNKCKAFYDREISAKDIQIEVLRIERPKKIRIFKTVWDAYNLTFKLHAPNIIIQTAYECGMGEKNALGFGCIKHFSKTF